MSVTEEAEEILTLLEQKQLCVSPPPPVRAAWQSGMPDGRKKGTDRRDNDGFFAALSGGTQKRLFYFFPLHIPFSSMKDGRTRDARSEEKKEKEGRREMSDIRQERDERKCIGGTRFDKLSIEKNTKKHCCPFTIFSP